MRVLLVHERYQQRGGEDEVFETERQLLLERGLEVREHVISNDAIDPDRPVALAAATTWNRSAARALEETIRDFSPDVAHFHNTFPLLSPAAYVMAKRLGVPVVKTHHNYRLLCANALLFRNGRACEDCVRSRLPWKGVLRGCYRNSRPASAATAAMIGVHRALGTWRRAIEVHVVPTDFAREKLHQAGIPDDQIVVKPNFVHPDPGAGPGAGGYALFAGRLSEEKGIPTLLRAWKGLGGRLQLRIVGDGPLADLVDQATRAIAGVQWLGRQESPRVSELMRNATCVVVPSICYESFGRVAIEAYAAGAPVVASSLGAIGSLVRTGRTGLHFRANDAGNLAEVIARELSKENGFARMRKAAREEFEQKYTAEANYGSLMQIYRRAVHGFVGSLTASTGQDKKRQEVIVG